ncbi:D-cysteine desulfhydrase family protein [Herbaspirillum sp. WKF16]|uniref:D-cysteine desulfhydrase family protein n=1 Tax=Herbaspirillum sp. WKF16 TaxID=3028312 RepID=UPI0023A9CC8E|nr:D-cysteine desulfhydrase family protein [Herbaspirillum sp. WKF16]WDZ96663.1 D-cysteine desulfhydrase family protein [Herbaspirillum sp. WKF16]
MHQPDFAALRQFPRHRLLDAATPIARLERLARLLPWTAGVNLYVKRDDLMAVGGGGNKLRKLEFLLGAAMAEGADTIVTVGGLQSNHARLAAAAAARAGLACELVLGRMVPRDNEEYELGGNVLLDALFGARVEVAPTGMAPIERARERAEELRRAGRRPFVIPTGGSTPLGSLGYVAAAQEILQQQQALGVAFDAIVVPNGSSGTHAGLAAGMIHAGLPAQRVRGFSVLGEAEATRQATQALAQSALELLGAGAGTLGADDIVVDGGQRGAGYGIATGAMADAVGALARSEGLLLDPVYSGKAFAGLLAGIREGQFASGANLLFVMTGGTPALYAYRDAF